MTIPSESGPIFAKLSVGVFEILIGFLLLITISKLDRVIKRVDAAVEAREDDIANLASSVRARNEISRMIGVKVGVPADEIDKVLVKDVLNRDYLRSRRSVEP